MRIRKHAKVSPLFYTCSVFPGAHLCQLNQSPWDVITFPDDDNNINQQPLLVAPPPPPAPPSSSSYQLDGYDSCAVNETFCDSQQSREAKGGHNLCEHHFSQGKKHCSSNKVQYSTTAAAAGSNSDTEVKQTVVAAAEITPSSHGRPHRPKKSSSSEYYYYSGFGPLWGKKRGPSTGKKKNTTPPAAAAAEIYSSHESTTHGEQSSSPQMDNEGIEHVKDEDDDAEEVENCKLIKRARKPIKARSLKSLM
ncbi:putative protein isoform X1 [Capsicum annuum]|uniref:uncharacterized protein LOC107861142 isoform X1 n=1 Tax=Capsicum annuum TaxID=4072 RepID=UPI001FB197A2|nr:uncharacterized protein LOC107861142 isoform X1 [Capsicum annuum]